MFDALLDDFSYTAPIPLEVVFVRLLGAMLLSGIIGIEREFRKNTAGLRTNMLIGLAAATFALITMQMAGTLGDIDDGMRMDPIRLVEAVTAGVAFLAAGIVVFTKGTVRGLTTGASMWLSGALGLAAGLGYWWLALPASVAAIIVLVILRHFEAAMGTK